MEEKHPEFAKFWKQNGTNLIVALVVTMVLCGLVAVQTTTFNLPVWLIIGLVCWVLHSAYLFTRWKKEHKK